MSSLRRSALLLVCVLQAQSLGALQTQSPPDPAEVARVAASLDEAFRSGDLERLRVALEAAQSVPDPGVVRRLAQGLADERQEVRLAVLQALRWVEHPDAREALHRAARDRKLMKVPELAAAVLRGIGQHAHPSSVPILARDPFEPNDFACRRARIFGLGRIRTRESLEALFGILAVTSRHSPLAQRRVQDQMADMRTSLVILTGVDQGLSPELWESWWHKNKDGFELPREAPLLPKEMRREWDEFWGNSQIYERERRREDRGK